MSKQNPPNILFIMGDDIGMYQLGAYHRGLMAGRTPNLDKIAAKGMLFTDYYAEASCTAGRAAFITGQLPIRTGLTTVGQAGAKIGMPKDAPTIADVLKDMGYATGQFGKNHLGDHNEFLPTVHGFDEFFGYLYHLDAMQDRFNRTYPPELLDRVGPRNVLHCHASDTDDSTVDPRWGRVGKQTIKDCGPLAPHPGMGTNGNTAKFDMETFDEVIRDHTVDFIQRAVKAHKPFFVWMNPTRMHVFTHLSQKYQDMITPENGWSLQEAGMAQLDDNVGDVLAELDKLGVTNNTIIVFTTDNGAETFTWPDGGISPFAGAKGTVKEGGFRVPCVICWPDKMDARGVENGIVGSQDWFPTFVAAAGNPNIKDELRRGKRIGDRTFRVHLDGYNQLGMLLGASASARHEFFYFAEETLGAVRIDDFKYVLIDQPGGWFGGTVHLDWPSLYNLRLDPFERAGVGSSGMNMQNFFGREFWRFVFMQEEVAKLGQSFVDFPPLQAAASFNLDAVKRKVQRAMAGHAGA